MIIVFSSNVAGGILQYAVTMATTLQKLGRDVLCYFPKGAQVTLPDALVQSVVWYNKEKHVFPLNKAARTVSADILQRHPSLVWYVDNATFSSQVGYLLAGKVKQALVMHDAGISHSSYDKGLRQCLKHLVEKRTSELCNRKIDWVITCSPSSKELYCEYYPAQKEKVSVFPLGPHMTECQPVCPPEIENQTDYFMFFGRIDKYKGIDVLLRTYREWGGNRRLVIAGAGSLQPEETQMAAEDERVILIHRFIKDEEMPYLFHNARAIALPYKDATQSGILPIAYKCSKPVICSNVTGLSQFVEDGRTGLVCSSDSEYVEAYSKMEEDSFMKMAASNARRYYEQHLDWDNNMREMITAFRV